MPMQWQNLPVQFVGGVDTKSDPDAVQPGKLLKLENAHIGKKIGAIHKRAGGTGANIAVGSSADPSADTAAINRVAFVGSRPDGLLIGSRERLYTHSKDGTIDRGLCPPMAISTQRVTTPQVSSGFYSAYAMFADCAAYGDFLVESWVKFEAGVAPAILCTIKNKDTGEMLLDQATVPFGFAIGTTPSQKVCATTDGVYFFATNRTNLYAIFWTPEGGFTSPRVTYGETFGNLNLAVAAVGATVYCVRQFTSGTRRLKCFAVSYNKATGIWTVGADTDLLGAAIATPSATPSVEVCANSSGLLFAFYQDSTVLRCVSFTTAYALGAAFDVVTGLGGADVVGRIGACGNAANAVVVFDAQAGSVGTTYGRIVSASAVVSTLSFAYTTRLRVGSRPVIVNSHVYYVADFIGLTTQMQAAVVCIPLATLSARVVGRCLFQTLYDYVVLSIVNTPSSLVEISPGKLICVRPTLYQYAVYYVTSTAYPAASCSEILIDLNQPRSMVSFGNNSYLTGGLLWDFDGRYIVESNFLAAPDVYGVSNSGAGGTLTGGATYGVIVCFEWLDARGRLHRSAPSVPASVTLGGGTTALAVNVYPLLGTSKVGAVKAIYMTAANGSTYYKVDTSQSAFAAVATTITITTPPAGTEEIIYTTGGAVENSQPHESVVGLAAASGRILAGTTGGAIWFSKSAVETEPISFSPSFVKTIPNGDRSQVSLGEIDGTVICATKSGIFAFNGEGPTDTGINDTYSPLRSLASDVGCQYAAPLLSTHVGVFVPTTKGIYLIDRGMQAQWIGREIDGELGAQRIVAAAMFPLANEVRFLSESGALYVFDYLLQQWGKHSSSLLIDCLCNHRDKTIRGTKDGRLLIEGGEYADDGQNYALRVATAWFQPAGGQGYFRIRKIAIKCDAKNPHTLRVLVRYDFDEEGEAHLVESAKASEGGLYVFVIRPTRQKCTALQVEISDEDQTGSKEAYALSGMLLEVGVKPGVIRTQESKRA